jgi:hypothetical protein
MNSKLQLGVSLVLISMSSCVSFSSMQTGKTVGKGEMSVTPSINMVQGNGELEQFGLPFLEVQGSYGIKENFDLQAKISLLGPIGVGAKYQFIGNQSSQAAVALGLQTGYFNTSSDNTKTNMFEFQIPIYASYHPKNWLSVYASPKYLIRSYFNTEMINSGNQDRIQTKSVENYSGSSFGIRMGKKIAFLAEYSVFRGINSGTNFSQFGVGLTYGGSLIQFK